MKYLIGILSFILLVVICNGQSGDIEYWRDMGYQAKVEKDYIRAIGFYQKVLTADSSDYDARLALARLFTLTDNYDSAIFLFKAIYVIDSTDVEALNGLGQCYGFLGEDKRSIYYFEQALSFLPDDILQYIYLAKAYSHGGRLDEAISVYQRINKIDNTWSEAWAGIGKMYYWKGMPHTAVFYYNKALALDPENEEYKNEYQDIQRELHFGLSVRVSPLREKEENYEINALVSVIKLEKRLTDYFHVEANFLLDYSNRDFTDTVTDGDTTRWFNTSWIKGSWIREHHKINLYGGYSNTDHKVSAYGLNWTLNYSLEKIAIKNSLTAGYDYFYYWNKVGAKSISDEVQMSYRLFGFNAIYTYGITDKVLIRDIINDTSFTHDNSYQTYGLSLTCRILAKPETRLGLNYSYLNYKYKSPLYYSPFGRHLAGASVTVYYPYKKLYVYGNFSYNIGTEFNYEEDESGRFQKINLNVNNWASNLELGYNYYPYSFSVGGSSFYNPYYQNLTGFIAVKVHF